MYGYSLVDPCSSTGKVYDLGMEQKVRVGRTGEPSYWGNIARHHFDWLRLIVGRLVRIHGERRYYVASGFRFGLALGASSNCDFQIPVYRYIILDLHHRRTKTGAAGEKNLPFRAYVG